MLNKKALTGTASAPPVFVEDVFSTYLYTGTGSSLTINNGIDLGGKGGLVWTKPRNTTGFNDHALVDSARGDFRLACNTNDSQVGIDSYNFSSTGFTLPANGRVNTNTIPYASWTFRKQPKFFDVVTYTGNGSTSGQQINHNLGSAPGMLIVKDLNAAGDWGVYQKDLGRSKWLRLNKTDSVGTYTNVWGTSDPTSTTFTASYPLSYNESGVQYVAYLFAHNAGGFGTVGTDNVISCGSFVTGSTGVETITLGYEPQYVMFKRADSTGDWIILDTMRGFPNGGVDAYLYANTSAAETTAGYGHPTATGFVIDAGFGSGQTYIYMAIRRPMKVPTTGTSVFSPELTSVRGSFLTAPVAPDLVFSWNRNFNNGNSLSYSRLTGAKLLTSSTAAETSRNSNSFTDSMFFYQDYTSSPMVHHAFKRASGFMDVVVYSGNDGASSLNIPHNLGVAPELMIIKRRLSVDAWAVYAAPVGNTKYLNLNFDSPATTGSSWWNNTTPSATTFTVGTNGQTNPPATANNCVAYLFSTCAGVSKVGSYTGNGGTQAIACGFTGGARFVLIKRTDSSGDWYVYDTARGMTALISPYSLFNTVDPETASLGSVTTTTGGFTVNAATGGNINSSGGSYLFLAIA